MTLKELIIKIQNYPEEMRVIIAGYKELLFKEKRKK